MLRTSHATWLKLAGADVKDAQAQMRHSRASTTLDIYQQFVPESQRRVVDKLSELTGTGLVNQAVRNLFHYCSNKRAEKREETGDKLREINKIERLCPALKRLASAVQLRPWPP